MCFNRAAFSLVELSIVLVILGLLVGGILAGQSLIRASELRAVSTEYSRYVTALHAFKDKYFALPGDISNATAFWGKDATYCNGDSGTANATTGTCNGDGSREVGYTNSAGPLTSEYAQAWRHLALAGLIEGTYTGIKASTVLSEPGVNVPRSKLSNGIWILYRFSSGGSSANYQYDWGNQLTLQQVSGGVAMGLLKPEEAWNVDRKLDDGRPGRGQLMGHFRGGCDTSTTFSDYDGEYDFAVTTPECGLRWSQVVQ